MPRKSRIRSSREIYHVVIRGVDRQLMFEEAEDYQRYLDILEFYKEKCQFKLFAYCLMSNHVHLLICTPNTAIDKVFRHINTSYSVWYNMKYQRTGALQQGRYYSEPINDDRYLITVLRYIHLNPNTVVDFQKLSIMSRNKYLLTSPKILHFFYPKDKM